MAWVWLKRMCAALAFVATLGFTERANAETLSFADAPAVPINTGWAHFQGQLADPCAGAPPPASCAPDPLVERTAHALGDDIDRIYLFVHDEIGVVPLFGVQTGARGALINKWGTPFDQTHLFVSLARAAGYQAEYIIGDLTLSQTEMQQWLGAPVAALGEVLADGGFPFDASGGNYTVLHLWARVNVGGTWYAFDPAVKRHTAHTGSLTTAGLDAAMGFAASTFINSEALDGAESYSGNQQNENAPEVRNFNRTNVHNALQSYSQNLLTHIRNNYADDETADVVGGRDIMSYAEEHNLQPVFPRQDNIEGPRESALDGHSARATLTGAIPYALRTQTTVTLHSSGAADVFHWRLDEFYGEELVLIPMEIFPQQGQLDPITFRFYRNGVDQLNADRIGQDGGLSFAFNHPYPANGGAYLDRTLSAVGNFHAGAVQVIVGGGRMKPDFGAYLEARSSGEEGWVSIQPTGMPEPPNPTVTGGQRATKRRIAASFAGQFGSAIDLAERIGSSTIVLHDLVIGASTVPTVMGSGASPLATIGALEVRGAVSANAHSGSASETLAVRRATAALAATLEGSAVEQNLDSVNPISTPLRLDWSSSSENPSEKRRFYWANQANWAYVSSQLLSDGYYGESQINAAQQFITAGYTLIVPRSSYLGPGLDEIVVCNPGPSLPPAPQCAFPGPERGGAFIAISPSGLIQWAGGVGGGGGGTNDAETNPARIFSIPEDFLERQFTSRAEAYNVDIATGNVAYTPPPDLVVGEGEYPYSLSFQRSYRSGAPYQRNYHTPPPPIHIGAPWQERFADTGWTSNWMHEARIENDGQRAFGEQSPLEATDTIVAIRVLLALSADQGADLATLQHQLGAIHAMAWWSGQLSYNAVQIVHGADNRSFFKLADGTYLGQPGDPRQIQVIGERYVPVDIGTYDAPHYYYNRMCVRATNGDGSTSFYGTWNGSFTGCDMSADPTLFRGVEWMRFRRQEFREGVVVSFDGATLENNLGRRISFFGTFPSFTVRDYEVQSRTVAISLSLAGPGVMSVTGTDGNTWVYDGSNPANWRVFAPSLQDPIVEFGFTEARGQVATLEDAVGNTARYWISSGRVGAMVDPMQYDPECDINQYQTPRVLCSGVASRTYFDEHAQPVRVVNRLGYETRTAYDTFRRAESVTQPEGNREEYEYNTWHARTRVRRVAMPGSGQADINTYTTYATTQQEFFATCGMPVTETDARGAVTAYALLANRCLISTVTQPAVDDGTSAATTLVNPVTQYAWNSFGQLVSRTDPTGRLLTSSYAPPSGQPANYLYQVTVEGGLSGDSVTNFNRNAQGDITSVVDPRNNVHTGTYDSSRRLTRYDGPAGTNVASEWNYDEDGLVDFTRQATTGGGWATTTYTYWPTGRVKTLTDPDGGVAQYFYDALNRLDHTLDPVNRRSESEYDAEGQVLQERRGVGSADEIVYATRTWTPNGQLDWVEDANHNRSELVYDGFDRLCRLFFPSPTTVNVANAPAGPLSCATTTNPATHDYEEYGYDANDNRTSLRLRSHDGSNGHTIAYTYDALNREILKDIPGGTSADVTSRYDLAGRRTFARFSTTLTPSADCTANNSGVDYCYDAVGRLSAETSYGRRLSFQYDAASNRTVLSYPGGGLWVQYAYDALNRVDQIGEAGMFSGAQLLADYSYDARSRRDLLARAGGGGVLTDHNFSPASRLTLLSHNLSGTANDANWAYTYTDAGQVETRTVVQAYEWPVEALDEDYQRNGLNQYTSVEGVAFVHDRRGNLTSDGARGFCYDLENRLTRVAAGADPCAGAATLELAYDPLGRLRQTSAGATVTQFVYDGDRLVAEYDGSGNVLRRYVHGPGVDEPIVWYEGPTLANRRWLVTDRQGSVIAAADALGNLVGAPYRYGPYGEPEDDNWTGSRFRYTGQIALPEAGLYHYKARVYDPGLGRFLQTDPVGYEDDLNLYAYVRNDPLNRSDPTGRDSAAMNLQNSNCANRGQCGPLPGPTQEQTAAFGNAVVDSIPVVGDVKGIVETAQNPTIGGVVGVVAGFFGADALRGPIGDKVDEAVDVFVDATRHPEAARHIDDAQAAGHPDVLTIDRGGADARRAESTAGHPTSPGMDRDEYPPAFTAEGGSGASVRSIPRGDNRGAGACIGNQCRTLPDGTQIRVRTRP